MAEHVLTVVGARPQFIKAALLSSELRKSGLRQTLVHTGQHYDMSMSEVFFHELGLPAPSRHLGIGGLRHGEMTGRAIEAIESVLLELSTETPVDCVLVFGDTNSTLAGALAATKLQIPVAHVEAGMRSFVRSMPEEINRVVTDHLASVHFTTHQAPAELLAAEGIVNGIHVVGDVMFDAFLAFAEAADRESPPERLGVSPAGFALATWHRAENTDDEHRLRGIATGLKKVADRIPVVLPLHPRTKKALEQSRVSIEHTHLQVTEPLGYLAMRALEGAARAIITDSGGVQKEALFAGVPCVTMRDETEWVETVECGWNVLVGADPDRIEQAVTEALATDLGKPPVLYGDGRASARIAEVLVEC